MKSPKRHRVCPAEFGGILDIPLRRMAHPPGKIVAPFIQPGMTVMDLGCGPGFFTKDLAEFVGENGRVIAVDIQQGMLDRVGRKMRGTPYADRVVLHRSEPETIGWNGKVDFILAFYVVHEADDPETLYRDWKTILNPEGKILIAEPRFHVPARDFYDMTDRLKELGWMVTPGPKICGSRSAIASQNPL